MLTVLQMVLEDAMRQGWIVRNVARNVDRVPQTKHEMKTFTVDEVRKLVKVAATDRLELAWHLALSGLRRGEVCGLTWEDVDLEAGLLTIRHTRVLVDGVVWESTPKTDAGNRVLPLPDALGRVFKRAHKQQAKDRLGLGVDYLEGGYVVADLGGLPISP
jgi:integrase